MFLQTCSQRFAEMNKISMIFFTHLDLEATS